MILLTLVTLFDKPYVRNKSSLDLLRIKLSENAHTGGQ